MAQKPRAVTVAACVVRGRAFEYGVLRLPLAMKAELEPG